MPVDDTTPTRLKGTPSWLIGQAAMHGHRILTERFAAAGARGYHYRLLAALQEFGPASQATLGRCTAIDRSDVVAALNELAAKGLIERSPDPDDRRRNIITLTPAGADHLDHLTAALAEIQDALLAPLSAPEREQLTHLLARVVAHHTTRP
ncbi:MarR family transcriptional regulator [Actinoallomurus liliacearum]|uniref:MarR family transcriptional regulator n=1 Tax=Actinoallomurus liliacearum TaxID=1080073 RepID=A0ABP8U065_9ACTN